MEENCAAYDNMSMAPPARYLVGQQGTPGQGAYMTIILRVADNTIVDARFQTGPCPAAHACGQFVADRLSGRALREAADLQESDIIAGVGPMPLGRAQYPGMAIEALRKAIVA